MKKIIYLTTQGEYDDYRITGAFSTRPKAENWLQVNGDSEAPGIEEWELDQYIKIDSKKVEQEKVYIIGKIGEEFTRCEETERTYCWTSRAYDKGIEDAGGGITYKQTYVFAKNEDDAKTKAQRIFSKAEKEVL